MYVPVILTWKIFYILLTEGIHLFCIDTRKEVIVSLYNTDHILKPCWYVFTARYELKLEV